MSVVSKRSVHPHSFPQPPKLQVRVYLHLMESGHFPSLANVRQTKRSSEHLRETKFSLHQILAFCSQGEKLRSKRDACKIALGTETHGHPHRSTIERNLVRLDIAWNNLSRQIWKHTSTRDGSALYLAYDSSPQGGTELFNTLCRIVHGPENSAKFFKGTVRVRLLPVVTLGHSKFTIQDKLSALMHQIWLAFGSGHSRCEGPRAARSGHALRISERSL